VALGAAAQPAAARATQPTASILLKASGTVHVGGRIELTIRAQNAGAARGFETRLVYDTRAAEVVSLVDQGLPHRSRSRQVRELGPVDLTAGVAFGSYSTSTLPSPAGDAAVARVILTPRRSGLITFRLLGTKLVDSHGRRLPLLATGQVVRVQVGAATRRIEPRGTRIPLTPLHRAEAAHVADISGDRRLTQADVTEAELDWTKAQMDGRPCSDNGVSHRSDANADGCIDVGDVQAFAFTVAHESTAPEMPSQLRSRALVSALVANPALTVDSTEDTDDTTPGDGLCRTAAGTCTLRAAITEANAEAGPNTIHFAIPGTGVHTIQLGSTLPTLTDTSGGTTIDGYSQPGASVNTDPYASNAQIQVEVKGMGPTAFDAMVMSSPNNVVDGLAIYNNRHSIWLYGPQSTGNQVWGDFVGTDATGTFGLTTYVIDASGVMLEASSSGSQIGTTTLAGRNVISGNARHGIDCTTSSNNVIYNNIVGLSPLGDRRLQNMKHGADFNSECSNNIIGGTGTLQRNIFSGDGFINLDDFTSGVEISHGPSNSGNQIVGNCFGTDVSCTSMPAYGWLSHYGIRVEDTPKNTIVSNNVVVNARRGGIKVEGVGTNGTQVTNNRVGVLPNGQTAANGDFGISIEHSAQDTLISGNTVANNPVGVQVNDPDTDGNTITRNSIYANSGLGIDLDPIGSVNPNDLGDADSGANQQLNFPDSMVATTSSVSGVACAGCTVEVFTSDSDPTGYGEGKTYLASTTATAAGDFTVAIAGLTVGQSITATATDSAGNTSEFSKNVAVQNSSLIPPREAILSEAQARNGSVALQWLPPSSDGGSQVTSYRIYRGSASAGETLLTTVANVTAYTDSAVSNGTQYWYRISAVNSVGEGPLSNELSAIPDPVVVADDFERTVASGWGTADIGGAWSVSNGTRMSVQNGEGVISGWTGGNQDVQASATGAAQDVDLSGLVRLSATDPIGASYQFRLLARAQADARNGYAAQIWHTPSGAVTWALVRVDNAGGTGTLLLGSGTLASSGAAGSKWWIRLRVQGSQVMVKFWQYPQTEPAGWRFQVADTYWTTGTIAAGAYVGNGLTAPMPDTGLATVDAVNLSSGGAATAPGAPSLTAATAGNATVGLQWSAPASNGGAAITNYKVYRGTASGSETLLTTLGNVTSYSDNAAVNGTTYFYKVSATNSIGESALSNELSATPAAAATAPGAPSLTAATAGNATVGLQWSAPASNGGAAITNYKVYRGTASGSETLLTTLGNVTSYSDNAAVNGTTYFYKVSATNSIGESALSNELSATPTAAATTVIVSDEFERTVASGFGTADIGGPWSVSSTSHTKVANGEGTIYGWTGGNQDLQAWNPTVTQNMEILAEVHLNATNPTGASYSPRVVARAQTDARNGYWARLTHTTSGGLNWALVRVDNAGGTGTAILASGPLVSSGAAGTQWWIRLRTQGTTVQARFWKDGTSEPAAWTATATDSYWTSGRAALGAYTNAGITSPFPDTGFASFNATDLG
jgi:CSLREA domain-containing protein